VNISARHFMHPGFGAWVLRVLAETGLPASLLELELTESVAIPSGGGARSELDQLRLAGVRIALDDFGTGYSSLSTLRGFPFDTLKIDRSFIQGLVESTRDRTVAKAVIELAHGLQMEVIAEGVELPDQLALLKAEGCDRIQGFLCSPALEPEKMEELLRSQADFRGLCLVHS
jgi:EAL domain-containing protein (putative c-di-GMP-specific phosphodiesterase class I)